MQLAYLVLENGAVFEGRSFGAEGQAVGQTVFTTGMVGYLETLTDKSHAGNIVVQTFPLVGNYGVIEADFESRGVTVGGYVVYDWCRQPSNFRSGGSLDGLLKEHNTVGICGIDTRRLTRLLREQGELFGMITQTPPNGDLSALKDFKTENAVAAVSTKEPYTLQGGGGSRVGLLDLGVRESMLRALLEKSDVTVLPHGTAAKDILSRQFDALYLSGGPGDPRENADVVAQLKIMAGEKLPIYGVGLGHQLLALAHGFVVERFRRGHRGDNYPVKDLTTGLTRVTSQNHGYCVTGESIDPSVAEPWYLNVNDGSNEGIVYKNRPFRSVQFVDGAFAAACLATSNEQQATSQRGI